VIRTLLLATTLLAVADDASIQGWMQDAFYPVLLGVLVVASLGIPIPEDIPLIAAGVLLKLKPGIASWEGTLLVALIGIMSGDLVLYSLGRLWGPGVVNHRYVRRLLTPKRYITLTEKFHRHGVWMVFFGRFFVGIRAAMCLTAGATRYPYYRFFLADLAGAALSIPFFVFLGWWFAGMIPTLRAYMSGAQLIIAVVIVAALVALLLVYRARRRRRVEALRELRDARREARARARAGAVPEPLPIGRACGRPPVSPAEPEVSA
jgi:membrane protein DedA with SNARE-associated domain